VIVASDGKICDDATSPSDDGLTNHPSTNKRFRITSDNVLITVALLPRWNPCPGA